jgi:hypothetical protein
VLLSSQNRARHCLMSNQYTPFGNAKSTRLPPDIQSRWHLYIQRKTKCRPEGCTKSIYLSRKVKFQFGIFW